MMDIMKLDLRELSDKAQRLYAESDQGGIEAIFGDCKTIEEMNAVAEDVYNEFFDD